METEVKNKMKVKDWYLSKFKELEACMNGQRSLPIHDMRIAAINALSELNFPTNKDEEWKYTNVASLLKENFSLQEEVLDLSQDELDEFIYPSLSSNVIVFVNGVYNKKLSSLDKVQDGVEIMNFSEAIGSNEEFINTYFAKHAKFQNDAFTALNTAFCVNGAVINIKDGLITEKPIHILNISKSSKISWTSNNRNIVVVGENSQLDLIESYYSLDNGDSVYFNNVVTETVLAPRAILNHYKVQSEAEKSYHINRNFVNQESNSVYTSYAVDLGGNFVRNNIDVYLNAENVEANLYGVYLATGGQLIDNHSVIHHANPNCESNELYKGILEENSKGVFNGKIIVSKDAQKTNAFQQNNSLVLSESATMNTKPQLEIFADDVKCSHGATIGQLDEEALFYLKSRGVNGDEAKRILQQAFLSEVTEKIKIDVVAERVDEMIIEKFYKGYHN